MTLVGNKALPELVCVYSREGRIHCIDVDRVDCVEIRLGINTTRDRIVWCDWHAASASGCHISLLTAHGSFMLANALTGRVEFKCKIKSPDDFTLKCERAALSGDVLWVVMENGDILALSPILPYPCKASSIIAKAHLADPSDSNLQRFLAEFREQSQETGIVDKMQRCIDTRQPAAQGPFLVQPEPEEYSCIKALVPFSCFGLDLAILVFQDARIDVNLVESPVMPQWSVDSNSDPSILTLMETILVEGPIHTLIPIPGSADLVLVQSNSVTLVTLDWVTDILAYLQDEPTTADAPQCVSRITLMFSAIGRTIADACLLGRSLSLAFDDGGCKVVMLPPSQKILKLGSLLSSPTLSSPFVLPSLPVPATSKFKVYLPKLHVPVELKSCKFPDDLNEDSLEGLLKIVHEWRIKIVSKCALLSEDLQKKVMLRTEMAQSQEKWAEQTMQRVQKLLQSTRSSERRLESFTEAQASLDQQLSNSSDSGYSLKMAREVRKRVMQLRTAVGNLLGAPKLTETIRTQMQMIEHIQSQIDNITIGA